MVRQRHSFSCTTGQFYQKIKRLQENCERTIGCSVQASNTMNQVGFSSIQKKFLNENVHCLLLNVALVQDEQGLL